MKNIKLNLFWILLSIVVLIFILKENQLNINKDTINLINNFKTHINDNTKIPDLVILKKDCENCKKYKKIIKKYTRSSNSNIIEINENNEALTFELIKYIAKTNNLELNAIKNELKYPIILSKKISNNNINLEIKVIDYNSKNFDIKTIK